MIDMFWKAAVLGIVQGITEFLPISSTGHLILVDQFLHMAEGPFSKMFNVVIQFGSILAVVIYFHKKLIPVAMFSDKKVCRDTLEIWFKTLAGVFPILLIGFLLASKIEMLQDSPLVVAAALLIGGVVLIKVEAWCRKERPIETFHELSYTRAVLIGLIQCLAMIPGTSRSASTIIGGLALGASRTLAAEYSFFLAIPTMTAASGYSLLKHGNRFTGIVFRRMGCYCVADELHSHPRFPGIRLVPHHPRHGRDCLLLPDEVSLLLPGGAEGDAESEHDRQQGTAAVTQNR